MKKLLVNIQRSGDQQEVFEVEYQPGMTVLDVLERIYQKHDPSIAYRFSCRTGLCTTCMMMINGKPGLSCLKMASPDDGILHLAPLPKGETVKDLVKKM
ncbi:2Fe-2S iron-sulfur cluster-binding protein [Texcoconibacillus texcoconensis]|uniref:Succinate dehydrogenase / fumarate reductase iron-sulfur subunit/fumarate reductase iron-sulfur subunit n=1 Tax=Texcoconibacillus texcoconensis TaxID=1095777 RepID=A0A840QQZ4_9BACI|nr:2Fe-2S iron-sulfur cluster-binding protein [Texcoconibacillus texcoconensis]MBB5173743.1 succinate dehydrogenase / fumarate reductase iron-sulfur subunit/fumarate reductase iron-sulfur subunit [Texcoconibacillus texcoconensis]